MRDMLNERGIEVRYGTPPQTPRVHHQHLDHHDDDHLDNHGGAVRDLELVHLRDEHGLQRLPGSHAVHRK